MVCHGLATFADALRAGSAEAKIAAAIRLLCSTHDALRAGSAEAKIAEVRPKGNHLLMHSVQAAPRQSSSYRPVTTRPLSDALRAGSAEAKNTANKLLILCILDALRAGSAEAKPVRKRTRGYRTSMHSVQAAPRQSSRTGKSITRRF